jgi:hypothetical protein
LPSPVTRFRLPTSLASASPPQLIRQQAPTTRRDQSHGLMMLKSDARPFVLLLTNLEPRE